DTVPQTNRASLLLVEVLAYQLASPVQWIKTQSHLFECGIDRLIEFGPTATLNAMAKKSLAESVRCDILFMAKDGEKIFYEELVDESLKDSAKLDAAVVHQRPIQAQEEATSNIPTATMVSVVDEPVRAGHVLQVFLATRLKKPLREIHDTSSIQSLTGGKSALQNEIVGDIEKEFDVTVERMSEIPLATLKQMFPKYDHLGRVFSSLVNDTIRKCMPGGFNISHVKNYLATVHGLGPGRISSVLMHSLLFPPAPLRHANESTAKLWLDTTVADYANYAGVAISSQLTDASPAMATQVHAAVVIQQVPDVDITAAYALKVFLALKFKKPLGEIASTSTIRSLSMGKSALQNEVSGDIEIEFGSGISSVVERDLDNMAAHMTGYNKPGKFFTAAVSKMLNSSLPGGYSASQLRGFLAEERCLGSKRIEIALVHSLLHAPSSRLASDLYVHKWINGVVDDYGSCMGLIIPNASKDTAASQSMTKDNLNQIAIQANAQSNNSNTTMTQNANPYQTQVEVMDFGVSNKLLAEIETRSELERKLNVWVLEHGQVYERGIQGQFDAHKIRTYESVWNWSKQELLDVLHHPSSLSEIQVDKLCSRLGNQATSELSAMIEFALTQQTGWQCENEIDFLYRIKKSVEDGMTCDPKFKQQLQPLRPVLIFDDAGNILYKEEPRGASAMDYIHDMARGVLFMPETNDFETSFDTSLPYVHVRQVKNYTKHHLDEHLTKELFLSMHNIATDGISFADMNALVTGCGRGSIAGEVVTALLEGGATVICTTSSFSSKSNELFRRRFERHGARGAKLILLPFNQASSNDCHALVNHIYGKLHLDLDFVIPFGAISVVGPTVAEIDSESELAHRLMLTNTNRLLGAIISHKRKQGWQDYMSVCGAIIGWTRGTSLMSGNNDVSAGVEELGVRTFSQSEMGFNLSSLLHPRMVEAAAKAPLMVDISGGLSQLDDLKGHMTTIRSTLMEQSKIHREMTDHTEKLVTKNSNKQHETFQHRAKTFDYFSQYPALPTTENMAKLGRHNRGMINLAKTVVVVGFGEVSPWGNARTRWEMEAHGVFSLEGCIELAWILGYLTYHNGPLTTHHDEHYIGWVDATTKTPVADHDVKEKYEESILQHSGIRVIEPELFEGYDPNAKMFLQQVALDKPLHPIEIASREEGLEYQKAIGADVCDIYEDTTSGTWMLRLRQGAVLAIPKALHFTRRVAGQIPTGWDPTRLGLPADIVDSVDPVTLYSLVATAEALVSAGITDPYEFYEYVHVSAVGNSSGSGAGGVRSLKRIFKERYMNQSIPSDTLQETFINTAPAWVNMLLLSSSGPIKPIVGACATAAISVDSGVQTILSGQARVVVVGGSEDFDESYSYEFAQMKATSDADQETRMGREPHEMCRPCSDTRGGFMESQGAGMQILMDAALAIEMGVPIYAIVGMTNTATDKIGRSVPAPGQGILTTAQETTASLLSLQRRVTLLNQELRRHEFDAEAQGIEFWKARQLKSIANGETTLFDHDTVLAIATKKLQAAQQTWGHDFFKGEACIAPLTGALNMWGLTIDDVGVASFHGTGTAANDSNESDLTQTQLQHLGRSQGNPLMVVCQKHMTGHGKGATAAWMVNGLLQSLQTGIVPGNVHLDNTDAAFEKFDLLVYPNRSIHTKHGIKAALMKSFGFGQAGAEILLIHPNYVLAALEENQFEAMLPNVQCDKPRPIDTWKTSCVVK
ncbi:hypothetical protein As57867_012762, partial [Aphanomyces stellatus]